MKVLRENDPRPVKASAAAVGFFDGVHLGHQFLLSTVKKVAESKGLDAMAVTFDNHPLTVLRPEKAPRLLTSTSERLKLLEREGIDACALLNFTKDFSMLSAREFMRSYLVERFNVKALIMGYDHSMGHDIDNTFENYCSVGRQLGIEVIKASEFISPNGGGISSTTIRNALLEGDVARAAEMLGHRYELGGKVAEGHHVGTGLGFPTANIDAFCSMKVIPKTGVYSAIANVAEKRYASVVNIGRRPTVDNGDDTTIEAFIIGFSGDIYGCDMSVEFVSRLRDEVKFASLDELRENISRDAAAAEKLLADLL